MTLSVPAQVLFQLLDADIEYWSDRMRRDVFSLYRDMPWTHEQRKLLQSVVRKALEDFVWRALTNLNNVGGVIPDNAADVVGFRILAHCHDEDGSIPEAEPKHPDDIGDGYTDYSDLWREYLIDKAERGKER
jgi:hypothetical protein